MIEAYVQGSDGEDYRTFPSIGEAISWCMNQKGRAWVGKIEIDITTGRIKRPERVNEKTLREFDFAWREMKRAA